MTTRGIAEIFAELYGADISPVPVSPVTEAVLEKIVEWQTRPLDYYVRITYKNSFKLKPVCGSP